MGTEVGAGTRMEEGIAKFNSRLVFLFLVYAEQVGMILIIIPSIFNS